MEAWTDLYKELAEKIQQEIPDIVWVDLWHEQVSYLTTELPFQTPAVFIAFNIPNCNDLSQYIQNCDIQVDFYLFFETFSDTYLGSYNQSSAFNFLNLLTQIHKTFHGKNGINYQSMMRIDMRREDSGDSGNLYRISFNCSVYDDSAQTDITNVQVNEVTIMRESIPEKQTDNTPLFIIPD